MRITKDADISLEKEAEKYKTRKVIYSDDPLKLSISDVTITEPSEIYLTVEAAEEKLHIELLNDKENQIEHQAILKEIVGIDKKVTKQNLKGNTITINFQPEDENAKIIGENFETKANYSRDIEKRKDKDLISIKDLDLNCSLSYKYLNDDKTVHISNVTTKKENVLLFHIDTYGTTSKFTFRIPINPTENNPKTQFIEKCGGIENIEGNNLQLCQKGKDFSNFSDRIATKEKWFLTTKTNQSEIFPSPYTIQLSIATLYSLSILLMGYGLVVDSEPIIVVSPFIALLGYYLTLQM